MLSADEIRAGYPSIADAKHVVLVLSHECTPDRDHYRSALTKTLLSAWEGGFSIETIDHPVQWGIRVVTFTRR